MLSCGGRSADAQLLPSDWVRTSTRAHVVATSGWTPGESYGYHCWIPEFGGFATHGYMGQNMYVFPDRELVVVFTAALVPPEKGDALLGTRAEDPAAPVHLDHGRQPLTCRHLVAGAVDVEADPPLLLAVKDDVSLDLHVPRPEHEEREPQVAPREVGLGRAAGDLLAELGLDRAGRLPGEPREADLDDDEESERDEDHGPKGALRRAEGHGHGNQEAEDHYVVRRELAREEAQRPAPDAKDQHRRSAEPYQRGDPAQECERRGHPIRLFVASAA
jgi:hypothetical protein